MYKILTDQNKLLGYTDAPAWVKLQDGKPVACAPVRATGVNYAGVVYNLLGHSDWPDNPSAYPSLVTDGEMVAMMNLINANLYLSKKQVRTLSDDDEKLHVSVLYEDWVEGKYEVGDIYNTHSSGTLGSEWEQTWECFQAYDNATYPDIVPGNAAWYTFNRPLHGKSVETARPFVPVQGAHDMYRAGEYMVFTDGKIYRCKQDTNFSPTDYAKAWEVVD